MSKKNKDKIKITFCGNNASGVTGSMTLVQTRYKNILIECGMTQSSSPIDDYKENSKSFPFKAKDIDYAFVCHGHIDHVGLLGKLVRDGFEGKIISTEITKALLKPMGLDSANIIRRDSEYLTKKRGKQVYAYYSEDDVHKMVEMTDAYNYDEIIQIDEEISFRFLHNSHIIGAAQLELFIKNESGFVSKILYTSDMGGIENKNHYVDNFEKCKNANIVISEATYGGHNKNIKCNRDKDLEKIKTTVEQVCNVQKGRLLIPVFSLSRSQQILTDLYLLYGDNDNFKTQIIVDSPLIWEINKVYHQMLQGSDSELFEKVCGWKNVHFIKDFKESQLSVKDTTPKIVLSSSGFLTRGRSINYLSEYIKRACDCILFCGYAPPNSIAGKIKSGQKNITIDGVTYKNKCGITILGSYSSHIQQKELLNYLKGISCDKVYLLHAEADSKNELKELLEKEYAKLNKTTRVISTVKNCVCNL